MQAQSWKKRTSGWILQSRFWKRPPSCRQTKSRSVSLGSVSLGYQWLTERVLQGWKAIYSQDGGWLAAAKAINAIGEFLKVKGVNFGFGRSGEEPHHIYPWKLTSLQCRLLQTPPLPGGRKRLHRCGDGRRHEVLCRQGRPGFRSLEPDTCRPRRPVLFKGLGICAHPANERRGGRVQGNPGRVQR